MLDGSGYSPISSASESGTGTYSHKEANTGESFTQQDEVTTIPPKKPQQDLAKKATVQLHSKSK